MYINPNTHNTLSLPLASLSSYSLSSVSPTTVVCSSGSSSLRVRSRSSLSSIFVMIQVLSLVVFLISVSKGLSSYDFWVQSKWANTVFVCDFVIFLLVFLGFAVKSFSCGSKSKLNLEGFLGFIRNQFDFSKSARFLTLLFEAYLLTKLICQCNHKQRLALDVAITFHQNELAY